MSKLSNRLSAYLWTFVAGWSFFMLLAVCLQVFYFNQAWLPSTIDIFKGGGILFLCAYIIYNVIRFYLPGNGGYFFVSWFSLLLTLVWLGIYSLLLQFLDVFPGYMEFALKILPLKIFIVWMVNCGLLVCGILWFHLEQQTEVREREAAAIKLSRDAELFNLRQQLQPHFLFNSLNSISALVTANPAKSREMINQLSDFLRGNLRNDDDQWSSFRKEIEYLKLYLEIEKVRFGHRLDVAFDISEESYDLQIPGLLLQPLVENAIKYGLYGSTEAVLISVSAHQSDGYLNIKIENPVGPEAMSRKGTGFGLSSVKRRLYLLCFRNDLLDCIQEDGRFIVNLRIPQPVT